MAVSAGQYCLAAAGANFRLQLLQEASPITAWNVRHSRIFCISSCPPLAFNTVSAYRQPSACASTTSVASSPTNIAADAASSALTAGTARRQLRMPSMEELEMVQLPALRSSFPSLVHPQYEQVKAECDEWIESVAQLPSAGARRFLRECGLPRLMCRFFPRALPGPRLLQASKFVSWLMIADDDDDHPELLGSDYAATAHRAERILAILATHPGHLHQCDPLDGRLSKRCSHQLAALANLWREMCPAMSPLLRSRFTSSMADYLEGIKMQAALRRNRCVPDVESYMEIRRHASFTIPAFIMVEYASGIELDQEAVNNTSVVELQNKAVDYVSLCNDIVSCYKEVSLGDYFNLPSIMYALDVPTATSTKACISLQEAIDHVAQLTQDLDDCCNSLMDCLKAEYSKPSIDPVKAYHIHAYIDVIGVGMSGALAWFHETPRYHTRNHALEANSTN